MQISGENCLPERHHQLPFPLSGETAPTSSADSDCYAARVPVRSGLPVEPLAPEPVSPALALELEPVSSPALAWERYSRAVEHFAVPCDRNARSALARQPLEV